MHAAAAASSVVTTALHGDVLVVTIDNPPVNALGAAVRQGLLAAMQQAQADAAVAAARVRAEVRFGRASRWRSASGSSASA